MIRRIIFSLKGWAIASMLLTIALLYQHFFRNPLCFSWKCIIWFFLGLLAVILFYSFTILPFIANKRWIKNTIMSLLFLIVYFINQAVFEIDFTNNLLASVKSIIATSLILVGISCLTSNTIPYKSRLIIRQVKIK